MEFILVMFALIALLFGLLCRSMALKRGRGGTLGFVLGFFFGLWAVLGYAIAGETEEKKVERLRRAMRE